MVARRIDNAWYVDFRTLQTDGTRRRIRRKSPVQTKRGAEQFERNLRQQALESSSGRKPQTDRRYDQFVVDYLRRHVDVHFKYSTKRTYRGTLEWSVLPFFGGHTLSEITGAEIARFQAYLRSNTALVPSSVNRVVRTLTGSLRVAVEWGLLEEVPRVKALKEVRRKPARFLSDEECQRVEAETTEYWRPMILVARRTGLRIGELLALRWENVDLIAGVVHVREAAFRGIIDTPKHDRIRSVPLAGSVTEALQRLRSDSPRATYVFQKICGSMRDDRRCDTELRRAARAAGLEPFGWHVLRHTFASQLAMRGVPIPAVQRLMGHSNIETTMRYAHLSPETLVDAVDVLDRPIRSSWHAPDGHHVGSGRSEDANEAARKGG